MTHWARPGVKCVCLFSDPFVGDWQGDGPKVGSVYTVSRSFVDNFGDHVVEFVELKRSAISVSYFGFDIGYNVRRFRPIITRTQEQDMELFTPLLDVGIHDKLEREFQ